MKKIGIFLIIGISGLCFALIFIIGEESNHDENVTWISFFGRVLAQDWILTPLILILIMLAI